MGFGSLFRKATNLAKGVTKIPGIGMIPGVGNVVSALGAASAVYGVAKGASSLLGGSGGGAAGGMPALPTLGGAGNALIPSSPLAGNRTIFGNDPNTIAALKPVAISKGNLRMYYRAPVKGYVVVKDEVGDPMAIPKAYAKAYFGWKPAKKPLLSVRDTNAIRQAGRAIKKLQHAEKMAKSIANWKSPRQQKFKNIIIEKKGGK